MKKIIFAISLLFSIALQAQITENREVTAFNAISVTSGVTAEITQGEINSVSVSVSDSKYLPYLKTVVENGTLKIYVEYTERKMWNTRDKNRKIKAFVTYKAINALTVGSGATVKTKNTITTPALALNVSSGAQFDGEIKVDDLTLDQSSGSISKISGSASSAKLDFSSGSNSSAADLATEQCKVVASSGAAIKIAVAKKLEANVSSGAVVQYKGNPEVNKNASSGGAVTKL